MQISFEFFSVIDGDDNPRLNDKIFLLLSGIHETGSISQAALQGGLSRRNAWRVIRAWEKRLGTRLCDGERGRGTYLTQYAINLSLAEQRFRETINAVLQAATADFQSEIAGEDSRVTDIS
jgi:molybdate transport repressor ModE-like protein